MNQGTEANFGLADGLYLRRTGRDYPATVSRRALFEAALYSGNGDADPAFLPSTKA